MKKIISFLSVLFILIACSTRKDKFLNRNFHALVVKYNVLFNGEVAFNEGLSEVEQKYYDDFSKNIPIEPFSFYINETSQNSEQENVIGKDKFDRAEDKAVKAIQKHSMLIEGVEKNYQIDNAYVLLGKSRYYTKRFGPALEAFEYVIKNYDTSDLIYETFIWRAKSNIHIGNTEFALRSLHRLIRTAPLDGKTKQKAALALAMGYEKFADSIPQLKKSLTLAITSHPQGQSAARANYLLAQLYKSEGDLEKSNECLKNIVANKKALYKFKMQARMDLMNNEVNGDYLSNSKVLKNMLRKHSNYPYYALINYQKGIINERVDSVKIAINSFQRAVNKSNKDLYIKSKSYERLGDIAFKKQEYVRSKYFYDSIIQITKNKETAFYRLIHNKSNGLKKIVHSLESIKTNDSLLKIAAMDDITVTRFFENHIAQLKEKERIQRIKEFTKIKDQSSLLDNKQEVSWYFYNPMLVDAERKEFLKKWNSSRRDHNWYAASLFVAPGTAYKKPTSVAKETEEVVAYDIHEVPYYTLKINKNPNFLDSIAKQTKLHQYELANAYYDRLKEKKLAVDQFQTLLANQPDESLKVGTYYKLYKIGEETNDESLKNLYKSLLNEQFPTSPFTKLTHENTSQENLTDSWSPESCYEAIYGLYKLFLNEEAKEELKTALVDYKGTTIEPKFLLLNAHVLARLEGKEIFYQKLKELQIQYPNTLEAKKAAELLSVKK